ncbi:unnamed protein product [Pylaiella littoralis]
MTRLPFRGDASTSSANLYGLVTLVSFMAFAPWAALTGWSKWGPAWQTAMEKGHQGRTLALSVVLSAVSHYLDNEAQSTAHGKQSSEGESERETGGRDGSRRRKPGSTRQRHLRCQRETRMNTGL